MIWSHLKLQVRCLCTN